jgi:arthrofactin-type cyclic lipopeptide synthetase C
MALRASGNQPPLFLITESACGTPDAPSLLCPLDERVPVYLMEVKPNGKLRTLHGMAACLLQAIRRIQPRGPYRLVGCSGAGLLAYETASNSLGQTKRSSSWGC